MMFMQRKIKPKEEIVRVANEYRNIIPDNVYHALLGYEFDIKYDRNYML